MRLSEELARLPRGQQIAAVAGVGMATMLLLGCGTLGTIGTLMGPAPSRSPKPPTAKVEVVASERPEILVTESPSPSPFPAPSPSESPSPSPVPTTTAPPPPPPVQTTKAPPPPVRTTQAPPPPPPPPANVYYANCDAVRAAGKAPLYANQPGYRPALDRDHDGVACEN